MEDREVEWLCIGLAELKKQHSSHIITGEGLPAVELEEGLWANIARLAADVARRKEEWVDLRPYWYSLDQKQD